MLPRRTTPGAGVARSAHGADVPRWGAHGQRIPPPGGHRACPGADRLRDVPGWPRRDDAQQDPVGLRPEDARRRDPHACSPGPLRPAAAPRQRGLPRPDPVHGGHGRAGAARAARFGQAPGRVREAVRAPESQEHGPRRADRRPRGARLRRGRGPGPERLRGRRAAGSGGPPAGRGGRRDPRSRRPDIHGGRRRCRAPDAPPHPVWGGARGGTGRPRNAARCGSHPRLGDRPDADRAARRRPGHDHRVLGRPGSSRNPDHPGPHPGGRCRLRGQRIHVRWPRARAGGPVDRGPRNRGARDGGAARRPADPLVRDRADPGTRVGAGPAGDGRTDPGAAAVPGLADGAACVGDLPRSPGGL